MQLIAITKWASEIQEIIGLLREAHFDGESGQSYGNCRRGVFF